MKKAVIVEIPQLGHATYLFSKPASMNEFLALYAMMQRVCELTEAMVSLTRFVDLLGDVARERNINSAWHCSLRKLPLRREIVKCLRGLRMRYTYTTVMTRDGLLYSPDADTPMDGTKSD